MLTKKQVCDRLGISAATLQRRMRDGSIKYSKGEGRLDPCYFDEAQFQVAQPSAAQPSAVDAAVPAEVTAVDVEVVPAVDVEVGVPADYGHSLDLDRLDEWTTGALNQLGRSFSVRAEAHKLVTHGIYSKIRNPIYVFGTVVFAGLVLVIHRPVLWLIIPVIIIVQTIRARREAQVLETAFGDAYREYRRKTWF